MEEKDQKYFIDKIILRLHQNAFNEAEIRV